ncbi:Protein CBG27924 [Caenorhabditis briggsae]|uniref:Protein CBG27924 n=2 Tax=Caenorhabditis briggsae TaxID=6238 RepID=B6IJL6_CAEBR|nr:Protein CBG27924 [Caenorhabditis briggsae]ULT83740.1 hypothetical protein L3Y34_012774 [Caenorhabditis briggsae]CAS00096.1 Protein CBG27924 [Caenorhabditis briggsae]
MLWSKHHIATCICAFHIATCICANPLHDEDSLQQETENMVDDEEEDVVVLDCDAEEGDPPEHADDEFIVVD